jgi:hypothetical protein
MLSPHMVSEAGLRRVPICTSGTGSQKAKAPAVHEGFFSGAVRRHTAARMLRGIIPPLRGIIY